MKWLAYRFVFLVAALVQVCAFGAVSTNLPEARLLLFNDYALTNNVPASWVHVGPLPAGVPATQALLPGTNHYHRTGWSIIAARTGASVYLSTSSRNIPPKMPTATPVYPIIASNLAASLQNTLRAQIESPVFTNGIGTIYFEAINQLVTYPTQITVEIATNMFNVGSGAIVGTVLPASTNNLDYKWESLNVLDLNAATSNDFTRYVRLLNVRYPAKMRIKRTGTVYAVSQDSAFTVIDNLRVSPPPSDVELYNTGALIQSGSYYLRSYVNNVDTNAMTLTGWYRWNYPGQPSTAWASVPLPRVDAGDGMGHGERFEAPLPPPSQIGNLEYYFACAFDGYCYQSPDYTGLGCAGYLPEGRSPFQTANQTNRYLFVLTVNNGSNSGTYTNQQVVTIAAAAAGVGKAFDRWTGATQYVASVTSPTTQVTMPAADITLTATYVDLFNALTVVSGTGSGSYTFGQQVTITASNVVGKIFDRWTGATQYVASATAQTTQVTMPAAPITLTATYLNVYALTVNGGTGGGLYQSGQQVTITASNVAGKVFDRWTGAAQHVASATAQTTQVTMPAEAIALTATYLDVYALTVNSGTGGGLYPSGRQVTVTASNLVGMTFARWTGATQYVASATAATTQVTMPALAIALTATYTTMLTSTLPESRILTFNDYALTNNGAPPTWVHVGPLPVGIDSTKALLPGSNHYHRTGWSIIAARTGASIYLSALSRNIPPKMPITTPVYPVIASNLAANLQNDLSARIESPVFTDGIGTIYFEAINQLAAYPTQITVDISTNMVNVDTGDIIGTLPTVTNNLEYVWTSLNVIDLNAATSNDFTRYVRTLNVRYPIRMRILRTGTNYVASAKDFAFTVIDNIRVSKPASDVVVSKAECALEPGYPAVNEGITIRCYVDNVDMNVPTDSRGRSVDVYYRWRYLTQASNAWTKVTMTLENGGDNLGNRERYKAVLPAQTLVGDLEYYFVCTFDGYRYQSPDYTGTGLPGIPTGDPAVFPYASENLSPRTLRGTSSGSREFYTRIRPYKSKYGALYVVTDQFPQPIEMALVNENEWRGMVPIRSIGATNLSWYFKGVSPYVQQGAETYSTNVSFWTEQAQVGVGHVPYGGWCVPTNASGRIYVTVGPGGYVQMTFNTDQLNYMTSRAEYQSFNAWPAPESSFSDSSGQDPKNQYLNTFDDWPANVEVPYKEYFIDYDATNAPAMRGPFETAQKWWAGSANYVQERTEADYDNKPTGVLGFPNRSLRLKGGDGALGLGYMHNQVATLPDGLKQISFKCRLGQPASNFDVAYNRTEFLKTNYLVKANVQILPTMSPEGPSLSVVAYFRDPGNFYEYRITQIPDSQNASINRDKRVWHQLYKWVNGVPTLKLDARPEEDTVLTTETAMEVGLFNETTTSTRIKCRYGNATKLDFTDGSTPHRSGTYGFLSAECRSVFSAVYTYATVSGVNTIDPATQVLSPDNTANFDLQKPNWYTPDGRYTASRANSPYGIYSVVPTQKIGVYLQSTVYGSLVEPDAPGSAKWVKTQEATVPSFGYTSVTVPLYSWKSQFVMLQVLGGTADVAVDEVEIASWRGQESGANNTTSWLATEAWVVQGGSGSTTSSGGAGLYEGVLAGAFNTTDIPASNTVQLTTRYANTTGWAYNTTYVYSGDIYLNGATYTFGENIDDNVLLKINGQEVLRDTRWNVLTSGILTLPAGWYSFELRVGNGEGGAGPSGIGNGLGNGLGVGYSLNGGATWLPITDPGNGTFLAPSVAVKPMVVQLDHSRGGRSLSDEGVEGEWYDQAIRSRRVQGMGLMEFDYRVLRGPAKLKVQYALQSDNRTWIDVQSFDNATTSGWQHASAYLGDMRLGYMRVLNYRGEAYTNALVEINNAVVWDEPTVNDTSWKAYNAKITSTDVMRVALDESKACFLNNSQTLEADPIQDQFEPYVQTPTLPGGLGELKFNARAYTNNQPTTVYVFASSNGWDAAESQWFEITRFENITNAFYQPFSFMPNGLIGQGYDAVRLMTKTTSGANRACLEEIVAAEPIFPGFDIVNVRVLCKDSEGSYTNRFQPLVSDDVGVEAQIANIQLVPSNIVMHVTYYIGTNVWGVDNWPAGQTVTKPMYPTPENPLVYRTSPVNDIPVQELDQVVQYRVWADYMGGIPLRSEQETFDNPAWYYPVDLNKTYASRGWSPYYFVYGVPLNAVWINEVNAIDYTIVDGEQVYSIGDNQYIEIAVPAGVDLAGWRVEMVSGDGYSVEPIRIPLGTPTQQPVTNGYAFFVIGEDRTRVPSYIPPLPKLDYGFPGLSQLIPTIGPGGLRLRRPQGMYEQVIAYDWNSAYGDAYSGPLWASKDPEKKFVYVGREHYKGSLSRIGNYDYDSTNTWYFPKPWTPGLPNDGQIMPSAEAIMPGVSNVMITSTMNSDHATQNGKRLTYYSLKLSRGASTNIVYAADPWYRIFSVIANQVEQVPPSGVTTNFTLNLVDLQTNFTVAVTVGLREDIADIEGDQTLLDWLLGFGDAPLVTSVYSGRALTLTELYWLNADPTVTNRLDFRVTRFNVDPVSNIHATVRLSLNEQNVTNLQGDSVMKIEVKQKLDHPVDWTLLAQYALSNASFDSNHLSRVTITNQFDYVLDGWDPKQSIFSRGMIEMEDPRQNVQDLVTEP